MRSNAPARWLGPMRPNAGGGSTHSRPLLLFLLLAVLVQGILVQSHLHFAGQQAGPAARASYHAAEVSLPDNSDSSTSSPLCQEAAMAGAYVTPSAPTLAPPLAVVLWAPTLAITEFALPAPPLGWLSRAPPE